MSIDAMAISKVAYGLSTGDAPIALPASSTLIIAAAFHILRTMLQV